MTIDGLWTSGDVLMRLTESEEIDHVKFGEAVRTFDRSRIYMIAMLDLVSTKLSDNIELLDMVYTSVLPKRDFKIMIARSGWTGVERGSRPRQVEVKLHYDVEGG